MSSRSKKKAAAEGYVPAAKTPDNGGKPKKSGVKKIVGLVSLILVGLLLLLVIADFAVAWGSIYRWIHPEKVSWAQNPSEFGLWYETFELETVNGTVYGWVMAAQEPVPEDAEEWIAPEGYSDKTLVMAPNYDGNREINDLGGADYFVDFCKEGYNVVTFDWTGSGHSEGDVNVFTVDKVAELNAVVEYAAKETGADYLAVQSVGFSCYPAAVVTAENKHVDALILDSSYKNLADVFFGNFGLWSALDVAPFRATVEWLFPLVSGVDLSEADLTGPLTKMKGKHLFFIQGEADEVFSSAEVQGMVSLAGRDGRNQASFWILPGGGHLRNRSYDAEAYFAKISDFLDKAFGNEKETA